MLKLVVVCFFIFISGSSLVFSQCLSPDPTVFGEAPSCTPKSFTLSALGSPESYNWYDAPVGGNLVFQGDFFSTPVLSVTTTYYVASVDNFTDPSCESNRVPITAEILPNPTNVSVFGNNEWVAYCFNGTNWTNYKGFYTDNNLSINTPALWNSAQSPNNGSPLVASYDGCPVNINGHSISYKRRGFPAGTYRIDVINHNDDFRLTIDGVEIMSRVGFGQHYPSAWIGQLGPASQVEYRWLDNTGASSAQVDITPISNPTNLYAGRISRNQAYCVTGDPSLLEDSTVIVANQDAYVSSGPFSMPPPGELVTNNFPPNTIYYTYLNFDIGSVRQSTFNNAYLYLYAYDRVTYPNKAVFVSSCDTTWDEATINWTNKPAASPTALTSSPVYDINQRWYLFDVSAYILSQRAAGVDRISFLINDTTAEDNPLVFYDRSTDFAPMLVLNNKRGGCSGYTFQWQSSLFCSGSWSDILGATTNTYDPPAGLTDSTCYRLQVTDGCLNTAVSNTIQVNIDPETVGGTLSVQEIDLNSGIISIAGNEGNVVRWEVSEDNFVSAPTNINTTTTQLNYTGSSSSDLFYRARVKSGACASVYTDTVMIRKVQEFILFNSFSPNHDGINDVWKINGIERYPGNKVSIVNFMGVPVYEASGYDNESVVWDGTANGQSLPDGTYYYSVDITGKQLMTGYVIIKR